MAQTRKLITAIILICVFSGLIVAYVFLGNVLPKYDSTQNPINIQFKYGVGAKNELNTFSGAFTKDLILSGTKTTTMILSTEELEQIDQKLDEIDFFNLPQTFPPKTTGRSTPQMDYYLRVEKGNTVKEVSWNSNSEIDSETKADLQNTVAFLCSMITEKPEYKALPEPTGGYM